MEGIENFLKRYLNLSPPDGAVRKALTESFEEILKIKIDPRKVKIVGTVAYVEIDTTTKSVFFIHQDQILQKVEEKIGKKSLTAIR
jgi:hypothetical protein